MLIKLICLGSMTKMLLRLVAVRGVIWDRVQWFSEIGYLHCARGSRCEITVWYLLLLVLQSSHGIWFPLAIERLESLLIWKSMKPLLDFCTLVPKLLLLIGRLIWMIKLRTTRDSGIERSAIINPPFSLLSLSLEQENFPDCKDSVKDDLGRG